MAVARPPAGAAVKVRQTDNAICACGSAPGTDPAPVTAFGKVYGGVHLSAEQIPANPTGIPDVVPVRVAADGKYVFSAIGGASHSSGAGSQNTLVVWVRYTDLSYTAEGVTFMGVTDTQTECEASATYCP